MAGTMLLGRLLDASKIAEIREKMVIDFDLLIWDSPAAAGVLL